MRRNVLSLTCLLSFVSLVPAIAQAQQPRIRSKSPHYAPIDPCLLTATAVYIDNQSAFPEIADDAVERLELDGFEVLPEEIHAFLKLEIGFTETKNPAVGNLTVDASCWTVNLGSGPRPYFWRTVWQSSMRVKPDSAGAKAVVLWIVRDLDKRIQFWRAKQSKPNVAQ